MRVQERARFTNFNSKSWIKYNDKLINMYSILLESVLASRPVWYYSCTKERVWQTKITGLNLGLCFFSFFFFFNFLYKLFKVSWKIALFVNKGANFFCSRHLTRKANLKPVRHVFRRWQIISFSTNSVKAKRSLFRCFIQVRSTLDNFLVSLVD